MIITNPYRFVGSTPPASATLELLAFAPVSEEMQLLVLGDAPASYVHTSTNYVKDYIGRYVPTIADEPLWQGANIVTQLARGTTAAQLNDDSIWAIPFGGTKVGVVPGVGINGEDALEFSFDDVVNAGIRQNAANDCGSLSVYIRTVPGAGASTVRMRIKSSIKSDMQIDETWRRICVFGSGATIYPIYQNSTTDSANVWIYAPQGEGLGNTLPGRYVENTKIGNSDSTSKSFATSNEDTLTPNGAQGFTVTANPGLPLAPSLLVHQDATCLNKNNSRDLMAWDGVYGTNTVTYDQTGITGEPSSASLLDKSDPTNWLLPRFDKNSVGTADIPTQGVFWVKKSAVDVPRSGFVFRFNNQIVLKVGLNTQTGYAWLVSSTLTNPQFTVVDDSSDWWCLIIGADNTGGYTNTLKLQVDVCVYAADDDLSADKALTGQIIIGNAQLMQHDTLGALIGLPPIFTTTAPVSIDGGTVSLPGTNYPDNTSFGMYGEILTPWEGEYNTSYSAVCAGSVGSNTVLIAGGGTLDRQECRYYKDTGGAYTWKGTSGRVPTNTFNKLGIAADASVAKVNMCQNGTWEVEKTNFAYTRASSGAIVQLGTPSSADKPFLIRNLRRYAGTYAQYVTKIEELMQ